jgi:DNA primase large subunit
VPEPLPDLLELAQNPAYEGIRVRALERLRAAAEGSAPSNSSLSLEREQLARALARFVAFHLGGPRALRSVMRSEVQEHHPQQRNPSPPKLLAAAAELHVGLQHHKRGWNVAVVDYLQHAPREAAWALHAHHVHAGRVALTPQEAEGLVAEAAANRLLSANAGQRPNPSALAAGPLGPLVALLGDAAQRLAPTLEGLGGPVQEHEFPPCMRRLQAALVGDANIDRNGRFAFVAFLHHVGVPAPEILRRFEERSDFNLDRSRYQIDHITGSGSRQAYLPPSCAKLQSQGLCPLAERTGLCRSVRHPLAYYRIRTNPRKDEPDAPAQPEAAP